MPRVLVVDDSATIRRIVRRTLSQAGFEVAVATDGRDGLEVVQREVPDLVFVDFVMPNMNGLKFVQAMRQISNLEHVPVVLMSAKADKIGDGFVAQTGALDAISKPFSPEALLTVAEHVLTKASDTLLPPPAPIDSSERISLPPLVPVDIPTEVTPLALADASAAIAMRIADLIHDAAGEIDAHWLTDRLEARFEPAELLERMEELAGMVPGRDGEIALRGRIQHVPIGDVLQLITQQRQTGVLEIEKRPSQSGRSVSICIKEGQVQLALGRVKEQEFRLGRFLLRESMIEREDLERIITNRGGQRGLLGRQLVKLGYISMDELKGVLANQTSELIYESLRWRRGEFRFVRFASRPEAEDANLSLPVANILMEGLRRVDEWRLIEEQIHSFDAIPRRDEEALRSIDLGRFAADERRVLDAIDGTRAVIEIVEHTRLSSFEVCKVIFQMATSRLVRLE